MDSSVIRGCHGTGVLYLQPCPIPSRNPLLISIISVKVNSCLFRDYIEFCLTLYIKGSTQPKLYFIQPTLQRQQPFYSIPVSCPCLSIFVFVFYVVLFSSYRLCCLPFPLCSVFYLCVAVFNCPFMCGYFMFMCLCLWSIVRFLLCFLSSGCLLFVLPSFMSLCSFRS